MYGENAEDVMYYLTVYNEPIVQPAEPEGVDAEGIVKGMYLLSKGSFEGVGEDARRVQLLAPASPCRGPLRLSSSLRVTLALLPTCGR
ncbi:pyruvate dehydrogenase E1 component [Cutibacterium acnes JCM 18916]|nr:pyruvate dehydrogenase E1 component [Cutibacterium acnes JCM 18916]